MVSNFHRMQGVADISALMYLHGIRKVVICPGSRNVPLINSFVSFSKFDCVSLVDERSAAYFALGMSQISKEPVAIICTSGTAALNIYPAISEAFYLGLPIVVITADRPQEWIDQGDGQTIRQSGIYRNHIKYEANLPVDTSNSDDLWSFRRMVSQSLIKALDPKKGPVHINIPLREPLYEVLPKPDSNLKPIAGITENNSIDTSAVQYFQEQWQSVSKKLIIVGAMPANEDLNILLNDLSQKDDTVIIAENISNINGNKIINTPEAFYASVNDSESSIFVPDLLISLGDIVVSKRMKQFLRKNKLIQHWLIGDSSNIVDTYQVLSHVVKSDFISFLKKLPLQKNKKSDFASIYYARKLKIESCISDYVKKSDFSDIKVTGLIHKNLPNSSILHLANSSSVRLSQLFNTKKSVEYFSNRGTSGIDGCVSTAAGSAHVSNKKNFLLCGDLAFLYDSNGLLNGKIPNNLKIIVLNNGGGNIFNLIKTGNAFSKVQPYLETSHNVDLQKIIEAFGLKYFYAGDINELKNHMESFINSKSACVFEIKTDMKINTNTFNSLYSELSKNV